jgi:pimeloyl-ACP methyl ester carboxylesterase
MWDGQLEGLAGVARVIVVDAPGFGETPPGDEPLRMDDLAETGAALLDRLGIARAVVGGMSMGGYAALAFAARFPVRLTGLVLADTRAGADGPEAVANRHRQAELALEKGPGAVLEEVLPKLLSAEAPNRRPEVVAKVRELASRATARGVANALRGMAERPDRTPALGRIAIPTLVVCGAADTLTPPAESERLHKEIRGSELVILEGAGHLSNLEAPEAFTAALAGFVRTRCGERG